MPALPAFSRALLTPGPLPPLSHLGATLLRYTVACGLRYAFYHLGQPVPGALTLRIIRLRLYLDTKELADACPGSASGAGIIAALVDPGGSASSTGGAGGARLAAAAAFHRLRLHRRRLPPPAALFPSAREKSDPAALWQRFRREWTRLLRPTNDALLAELLAALRRRSARAHAGDRGAPGPCLSRAAADLLAERAVRLDVFGLPDPLVPSGDGAPALAAERAAALARSGVPSVDSLRGRFRETYRAALTRVAPLLAALGAQARERGLLAEAEDLFFLPWETLEDVAHPAAPWVRGAAAANRAEYVAMRRGPEPPELLQSAQLSDGPVGERPEWEWASLLPLP